ncbi:MAG: hypothetical protein ABI923_11890 [bacterium]
MKSSPDYKRNSPAEKKARKVIDQETSPASAALRSLTLEFARY